MTVTSATREHKVFESVVAVVLFRYDMIDLKSQSPNPLRKLAVLASLGGAGANGCDEFGVH